MHTDLCINNQFTANKHTQDKHLDPILPSACVFHVSSLATTPWTNTMRREYAWHMLDGKNVLGLLWIKRGNHVRSEEFMWQVNHEPKSSNMIVNVRFCNIFTAVF